MLKFDVEEMRGIIRAHSFGKDAKPMLEKFKTRNLYMLIRKAAEVIGEREYEDLAVHDVRLGAVAALAVMTHTGSHMLKYDGVDVELINDALSQGAEDKLNVDSRCSACDKYSECEEISDAIIDFTDAVRNLGESLAPRGLSEKDRFVFAISVAKDCLDAAAPVI